MVGYSNGEKGLTTEERLVEWQAYCAKFHRSLTDRPGTILSAEWRLAVVDAAQKALDCPACASMGDTCFRPGTVFTNLSGLNHQPPLEGLKTDSKQKEKQKAVLDLIHTIVNHQSTAEEAWYQETTSALDKTGFVPSTVSADSRRGLIASLIAEILGLTIISHGINISYRALKRSPPPMPLLQDVKEMALEPSRMDLVGMLKPGKTLRVDNQGAGWAPFVEYSDLEPEALASRFEEQDLAHLKERLVAIVPFCILSMSPHDFIMVERFFNTFGYDQKDIMKPFAPLDPNHHCGGFSRYDKEVVADVLAATYNCGVFRVASVRAKDTDGQRQQMLVGLAKAVATRPYNAVNFNASCLAVKENLGEGALIEAIGVAAGMDAATRCVDIAGKDPPPPLLLFIMRFVLSTINWILSFFR